MRTFYRNKDFVGNTNNHIVSLIDTHNFFDGCFAIVWSEFFRPGQFSFEFKDISL